MFKKKICIILTRKFNKLWLGEENPEKWFTTGRTILFFKNTGDKALPKNYRPITMLNTCYKVFTSVLEGRVIKTLLETGNWDPEQHALISKRRGCLDAHLISEMVISTCQKITKAPINCAFIDFCKAYDSISHQALIRMVEATTESTINKPNRIVETLKALMPNWCTYITNTRGDKIRIDIKRGIFQGDKMSPTLFCVALTVLKANYNRSMSIRTLVDNVQVDKICYMDDIKMFDTSLAGLGSKVNKIKGLAKLVGLEINEAKSGVLTDRPDSELAETQGVSEFPRVEEGLEYKYLGLKQHWINTTNTKEDAIKKAKQRICKLVYSPLTIINIGKLIRVYAVPLVRYIGQFLSFSDTELNDLTKYARVMLKRSGRIPWKLSNGRVHARPECGGLGIPNFRDEYWLETLAIAKYIGAVHVYEEGFTSGDIIQGRLAENIISANEWLVKRARQGGISIDSILLKITNTAIRIKNETGIDTSDYSLDKERETMRTHFEDNYQETWDNTKLPSGFNRNKRKGFVCGKYSYGWLKNPGLGRGDCKKILLLQDGKGDIRSWHKVINRNLDNTCRKCKNSLETVGHVLGGCPKIHSDC
jgi:hypothetical protein